MDNNSDSTESSNSIDSNGSTSLVIEEVFLHKEMTAVDFVLAVKYSREKDTIEILS